ncbi:MAG: hypothetical protein WBG46_12565 [Nonlabens sp.]
MSTANKRLVALYTIVFIVLYTIVYCIIFDSKLSIIGDNASYYILGRALSNGEGFTNIHLIDQTSHFHYPPGYPAVISIIITFLSNNIITIKIFNGLFLVSALLILMRLFYKLKRNIHITFLMGMLLIFNKSLLQFSTIIMSEIPFLLSTTIALYLIYALDYRRALLKNWKFGLVILLIVFSIYLRSLGIALAVGFGIHLLTKKYFKFLLTLITVSTALYLPWILRGLNSNQNSYFSQLMMVNPYRPELGTAGFFDLIVRAYENLLRYVIVEIPSSLAYSVDIDYNEDLYNTGSVLIGCALMSLIVAGGISIYKKYQLLPIYVLCYFLILLIWPSSWYGTRFITPLIPLLVFFAATGLIDVFKFSTQVIPKIINYKKQKITIILLFGVWMSAYAYPVVSTLHLKAKNDYHPAYENYFKMAEWVKKNAVTNSVTCTRKDRLFYVFSENYVTNFKKTVNLENQIDYLKSKKVSYVVLDQLGYSSTALYLKPTIDRYPNKFKLIQMIENPDTYLFEFKPELGYWGDWKNDQRNGQGTYQWADGQKYEGLWKDNVRHGRGTVYFSNGNELTGEWIDGKIHGKAFKKEVDKEEVEVVFYDHGKEVER